MEANTDQPKAPESKDDLKSLPLADIQEKLESAPDGLTQDEAQKKLAQYDPNELEEKKTNPFLKFISYFWAPIPWKIEAAVILSAVDQHWPGLKLMSQRQRVNSTDQQVNKREASQYIQLICFRGRLL